MTANLTRRGFCTAMAGASAALALPVSAASPIPLTARTAKAQIAPPQYAMTDVWSYDGKIPGSILCLPQGGRLTRRLVNELPVPTSIHWHGIRIDNAMDGVAGLTQDAVPSGEIFDYDFTTPDAGTYWYHAHTNSMEQVARGLSGPLIVEEQEPPDVDRDEVILFDDWLLNPETAQFAEPFNHPMMLSHAGRIGNLLGANGSFDPVLPARRHERLRLRLINAANARILDLRLHGLKGWTVALDGMPLKKPEPVDRAISLAPAQRVDLIVDVIADKGEEAGLLHLANDDSWQVLVRIPVTGKAAAHTRAAPVALPPNPRMDVPGLDTAQRLEMTMEGGAMRGLTSASYQGRDMGGRELMQNGQFWALAGQVGMTETPFARFDRGETVRLKLMNNTVFAHAMHLHGMHFRQVRADGSLGPMRDTILSLPNQPVEIAFVANNPGKWLFHCHMLAHAASGMNTWIEVA
ncbi:multicopper oxidase family protein [Heliomarina baculiformis]|uniref:multicopper oxidase family protein n=1 Tax=Heliomarina baculiformis TaxID=2872036 RepID=UPI001EE2CD1A|nr:multicopper oxidase family protein [Heliomarina baculiformis]